MDSNPITPRLLTLKQAATYLCCCEKTIHNLEKAGKLRVVRTGGFVRVDTADIEAFIRAAKEGNQQ